MKTKAIKVADDYLDLVRAFPLRPIRSEADYDQAIEILKDLAGRTDDPGFTAGERDYTDTLSQLVGCYEKVHYPRTGKRPTPIELLKFLMGQNDMNSSDLGELLGSGRGQASMILNGKRELSKANIRVLADRFKVNPGLFL